MRIDMNDPRVMEHSPPLDTHYSAEASDLGLPVGVWPRALTLVFPDREETARWAKDLQTPTGDFGGRVYHAPGGISFTVFND